MSPDLVPRRVADDVFEIVVASPATAQQLAQALRQEGFAEDVVAGLASVSIRFDPMTIDTLTARLQGIKMPFKGEEQPTEINEVTIEYGGEAGPDLEQVCAHAGLSVVDFIALHTKSEHTVEMIGFTPGFSYISGLPEGFKVPRLSQPRSRVPAGAVGISAAFTGIYALPGPGGWPLIGRTTATLFDRDTDEHFLLKPGQRVRFRAV
ncbi:MAG: 5-oxoprolinase subunit PxpB [Pseudomonadota bacterium]